MRILTQLPLTVEDFWNCAQAQTGPEIFALVESI